MNMKKINLKWDNKKALKIFAKISGFVFDFESIALSVAYFILTLITAYNDALSEFGYSGNSVVSSIPEMLCYLSGLQTVIITAPFFVMFFAVFGRITSYLARNRKILSFFANTVFLVCNGFLYSIVDGSTAYNFRFKIMLAMLCILYAINNGKIIFDFLMWCYKKYCKKTGKEMKCNLSCFKKTEKSDKEVKNNDNKNKNNYKNKKGKLK